MDEFIWDLPKWMQVFNVIPTWLICVLLLIILPGIKTDFSGELVWWEPWFYILIRDYFRKKENKTDE